MWLHDAMMPRPLYDGIRPYTVLQGSLQGFMTLYHHTSQGKAIRAKYIGIVGCTMYCTDVPLLNCTT